MGMGRYVYTQTFDPPDETGPKPIKVITTIDLEAFVSDKGGDVAEVENISLILFTDGSTCLCQNAKNSKSFFPQSYTVSVRKKDSDIRLKIASIITAAFAKKKLERFTAKQTELGLETDSVAMWRMSKIAQSASGKASRAFATGAWSQFSAHLNSEALRLIRGNLSYLFHTSTTYNIVISDKKFRQLVDVSPVLAEVIIENVYQQSPEVLNLQLKGLTVVALQSLRRELPKSQKFVTPSEVELLRKIKINSNYCGYLTGKHILNIVRNFKDVDVNHIRKLKTATSIKCLLSASEALVHAVAHDPDWWKVVARRSPSRKFEDIKETTRYLSDFFLHLENEFEAPDPISGNALHTDRLFSHRAISPQFLRHLESRKISCERWFQKCDDWHFKLATQARQKDASRRSEIASRAQCYTEPPAKFLEDENYSFVWLGNELDLYDEGKHQGHCVHSYDQKCRFGESVIFSLREADSDTRVTVEFNNLSLVQSRGKFNRLPTDKEKKMIAKFAKQLKKLQAKMENNANMRNKRVHAEGMQSQEIERCIEFDLI
jgi:hypothetical protein